LCSYCLFLPLIGHRELYAQSRGQRGSGSVTLAASIGKSDTEKRILVVLDDLDRNQRLRSLTVPAEDARLLRVLTEAINAKHVVELGTANGYSGIWFALALQTTGGKLTTFEIDPQRVKQARENFKRAGVDHLITQVEGDAHQEVTKLIGPVDLVFIDADKDGYVDYLNELLPLVRPGGLVVAHNMRVPPPDPQYVNAITTNPDLETVFLNMHSAGIAVTLKKR
jgi:caffeoyl-CoA O-methyltransferase